MRSAAAVLVFVPGAFDVALFDPEFFDTGLFDAELFLVGARVEEVVGTMTSALKGRGLEL